MATMTIDAAALKALFLSGAAMLESKKEWINELNVFPVPDGDTGTNMSLTITSAVKEIESLEEMNMTTVCKAISSGSLRGARGNSGVIMSQLLRGLTKVIRESDEVDAVTLAKAFTKAVETAYKAVMKPKEGTILTVAKGMAEKINELAEEVASLEDLFKAVIEYGDEVLDYTPELLPVLKQAGVVDSGGQGLMQIMKGAYAALCGNPIAFGTEDSEEKKQAAMAQYDYKVNYRIAIRSDYTNKDTSRLKGALQGIGDAITIDIENGQLVVEAATNNPGLALEEVIKLGKLVSINAEYIRKEEPAPVVAEKPAEEIENKKYGFISISAGEGLTEIFKSLGVDHIIEGGQTMNPSTEDMLNAIDMVHADNVFIFPNNSNIILAAQQAQRIVENKNIVVVPTKTIPQGISAMIAFSEEATPEENLEAMTELISNVKSGSVTYAVRDTEIDDKVIKENDIMGIGDKTILSVGQDITEVTKNLIAELATDESELISIYYGQDVTEEDANNLASLLEEEYPDMDIEVNNGGQPIYYYILSVE